MPNAGIGRPTDRGDGSVDAAVASWLADHTVAGDPLIVACSGGPDSLALAVSAHNVVSGIAPPHRLIGATVDHRLQPGSADRATATAAQLGGIGYRQVEVLTVDVVGPGGLEAAARRARYRALRLLAEQEGTAGRPCPVLLAHTADDQAETVLLGLARGSGPRSIAGMRPWRPPWGRPLLGVSRQATVAACHAAGLVPWQDPHNRDHSFTRVRLRHEVLPLLEDVLGGGVRTALGRTARLMTQDLDALDEIAQTVLTVSQYDGGLSVAALIAQPTAIRARVLRAWVSAAGAGPLTFELLSRMVAQLDRRGPTQVRIPGGFDVVRTADDIRLVPHP